MIPIGSLVNALTVIVGSTIGLITGNKLPTRFKSIIFQAVGLATLVLGMQMAFEVKNFVIFIFSLIFGAIIGEAIHLETRMEHLSEWLKTKVRVKNERFTEGLITAFLIFCVGSTGDRTLILSKSVLDGFTSMVLASVYGVGVLFSVVPLFLVQGSLTLLATPFQAFFSEAMIAQLTAVGGALILGIGLNLLEIKKVKTMNLLPGLVVVVVLTLFFP